jgi:hypothetical protein
MDSQGNRVKTVPPTEVEGRPPSNRLRSVPPLDPTVAPSISRLPIRPSGVSGLRPIAQPILASECLKDDIAPVDPFARACRFVFAVCGVSAIAAAAIMLKTFPAVAFAAFAGGALMTLAAALTSYRLRGAVGALGASTVLFAIVSGEHSWALRAIAATVLASALFTRASYRAHRGVRVVIGVGIALFVVAAVLSIGAQPASKFAAGAMGLIAAASLLGFMGEQTTGGSAFWAALVLITAGASIAVVAPVALVPLAAMGTLVLSTIAASTSAFALAASVIAPIERAREHRGATTE